MLERLSEGSRPMVVRQRLAAARRIERLHAMQRRAVGQPVIPSGTVQAHAIDAEEGPRAMENRLACSGEPRSGEQHGGEAQGEPQWAPTLAIGDEGRHSDHGQHHPRVRSV